MTAIRAPLALLATAALAACGHIPSGGLQDAMDALNPAGAPTPPPVRLADAPRRAPQAGDTFIYGRSTVRRVVQASGQRIEWATTDDRRYTTSPHFFTPLLAFDTPFEQRRSELRGNPAALWPLQVGRSVEFDELRTTRQTALGLERRSTLRWQCEVTDARHVSVPAGDYDSFHVRCEARLPDLAWRGAVQVMTWDYAPALGHYVRRQWYEGSRLRETVLSAALPGAVASRTRIDATLQRLRQSP